MSRREGSVLVLALLVALTVSGLTLALIQTCIAYSRSASHAIEEELATRAAESGVSYYLAQVTADPGFFDAYATPSQPIQIGRGTFVLESVEGDSSAHEWKLEVTGRCGRVGTTIGAAVGYRRVRIPTGLVVGETAKSSDVNFNLDGGSSIGSYNPLREPFDIDNPGDAAQATVNGDVNLGGSTFISGDLVTTGDVIDGGTSGVTGDTTELEEFPNYDPIDEMVADSIESSRASNDNDNLAEVFGKNWKPVDGGENYGDLIVESGRYVVPAGTYRFRRFEVREGAEVVFDTSDGPTEIVYMGDGSKHNEMLVSEESNVYVSPDSTTNDLTTVLAPSADFRVQANSSFGQAPDAYDSSSGRYTKVISLGNDPAAQDKKDDIVVQANSSVYGQLYAEGHDVLLKGNSGWYGTAMAKSLDINGSKSGPAVFAVDESVAGSFFTDPTSYEFLASWPLGSPDAR